MRIKIISIFIIVAICLYTVMGCSNNSDIYETDYGNGSGILENNTAESEENMKNTENIEPANGAKKELSLSIINDTDIDKLLARPYDYGVPTAFSEGLFSLYSEGWGFKNNKVLATGNAQGIGLPVDVRVNGISVAPTEAIWMPSHVLSTYDSAKSFVNIAPEATVSASFTSKYDTDGIKHLTDGTISYGENPRNRWSNYDSPARTQSELITFKYSKNVTCAYFVLHFFDDGANTRIPKAISVEYFDGANWVKAKNQTCDNIVINNGVEIRFDEVQTRSIRVVLTPQENKSIGITEIRLLGISEQTSVIPNGVMVEEKKFITENDMVVSYISLKNNSLSDVSFEIFADPNKGLSEERFGYRYILFGGNLDGSSKAISLSKGESAEIKLILAVSDKKGESQNKISTFLNDENSFKKHIEQFSLWFKNNIPYFDCDDPQIKQIYYFRWLTYRNNIRKITDEWNGFIISEFLPNVAWSGLYNSISCPGGHHYYEGRWIRDSKYLDAYSDFWFIDGANPRLYSFPIADAYYNRYLVSGDKSDVTKYFNSLNSNYAGWEKSHYVSSLGLFKQIADRDGMEKGIGGDGVRPTINSYMYGDAIALEKIATMIGNSSASNKYKAKAESLKKNIMSKLWNEAEGFFETISTSGKSVNVRELIGYIPWYFNLPDDDNKYSAAFAQLNDSKGFLAEYGPTTAEQRDSKFMAVMDNTCRWDGPSWPFATAQTLTASANLLNNYKNNNSFNKGNWFDLLKTYTKSQYKNGYPWISEDLHPITGEWIIDKDRSIHYNHSTYTDNVITGLAGIRPDDNDKSLVINPLLEKGDLKYFMLENVCYRGHDITIIYDESGNHYGVGQGLMIYVDGILGASSDKITSLKVDLK